MINVFEPDLGDLEIEAVTETILSKWIGKGSKEKKFREDFAIYLNTSSENLISYNSCTEGFFQLFEFLNLKSSDEVILPTISFVGVANAVKASGAKIIFCDIDERTGNPTLKNIKDKISKNTKAVVYQYYGGNLGQIEKISEYCKNNKILLIEDAAAAIGTSKNGIVAGRYGDFAIWSFDAMKSISCGDGGILFSREPKNIETLLIQGYLGLDFKSGLDRSNNSHDRWWDFRVKTLGRRSIMNDISASIGIIQLGRLEEKCKKRHLLYQMYLEGLSEIKNLRILTEFEPGKNNSHSFYFFPVSIIGDRDFVAKKLRELNIYTTFRYLPLHKQGIYGDLAPLPAAEKFANEVLLLPMHTNLTQENIKYIIDSLKSCING